MIDLPLIRSTRSFVKWMLLFVILLLASFTPFSLWVLMLLYLTGTCALVCATLNGGLLAGAGTLILSCASMHVLFGSAGALCTLVYLGLTWLTFLILYIKKVPFWQTTAALILCQFASQLGIYLVLDARVAGDLFTAAGMAVSELVKNSEIGDILLTSLYQTGLVSLSPEFETTAVVETLEGFMLSDAARNEMLLSLSTTLRTLLYGMLPGMLISHSIETGVLTAAWPLHQGDRLQRKLLVQNVPEKRNPPVHTLDMPPLREWHIPKPWGLRIGILGAGYFLALTDNSALQMLGQMFYSLFSAVYAIQGIATINFIQHKKGSRKGWRVALPLLLSLLMPNALMFLGLIEQVTNLRMLRPLPNMEDMPDMPEGFPFMRRPKDDVDDENETEDEDDNDLI